MFEQKFFYSKFLVDNYSWGNDFAAVKISWPIFFSLKCLVDNYSWGNDFATKQIFDQNFLS